MDELLNKYIDYQKLVGCKINYVLENGYVIDVVFKKENFLHLLGLHKLKDIRIIQDWQDKSNVIISNKDVIRNIKTGKLNYQLIKTSHFFAEIEDRFNSFSYSTLSSLIYTDAIVEFDASKVPSKLLSDYILFKIDFNNEFNHMGIGMNKNNKERYFETFFHEPTNKYIKNQNVVKIVEYSLVDREGNIIIKDRLY